MGKRNNILADYMTPFRRLRLNLAAADSAGVADVDGGGNQVIPWLNTKAGPNDTMLGVGTKAPGFGGLSTDGNFYGRNAQIDLAVVISGFSSITLQLWMLVEETDTPLSTAGAPAAITQPASKMYVLVDTKILAASGLWIVKDVPPGYYKVLLTATSGSGAVTVLASYAC